jgi:signal transduction histidine kinase
LVEEVAETGLEVALSFDPPPRPVAAGVGLTIYRIVQEALTNVVRHAGAGRARVAVSFVDDRARVEVTDDGPGGAGSPREGHGIPGMRERVSMHGGTFDARPLAEGGFVVSAAIPLEGETT